MKELNVGAFEGDRSSGVMSAHEAFTELKARTDTGVNDCTITVNAEATNVINVDVQLLSPEGVNLAVRGNVQWYLSADIDGDDLLATAPTGGVASGTNGFLIETVADKAGSATSNATGAIDFDITDTGTPTMYLIVVLPDGRIKASSAITFA